MALAAATAAPTAAAVTTPCLPAAALAQSYPVKSVRIIAPVGTPAAIVNKISSEIAGALKSPEIRDFMAKEGAEPVGSTPQELAMYFKREVERYAKVIKAGNARIK